MKKEIIEEKYRAACGIRDDYKFTTDEEYLINEIFKAYNKGQKLTIPAVVGRSEQLSCGRNITTCVFYKDVSKCSNLEYCKDQTT